MRPAATRSRPGRHRVRRAAPVAVLALVGVLAAGCGGDGDGSDGGDAGGEPASETTDGEPAEAGATLTEEQLEAAVLDLETLGEGWTEGEGGDDEEDEAPGCLADVDELTESIEEEAEVDRTFGYGEQGIPQVQSGASSFADEEQLAAVFDDVQQALRSCTRAQGTDDEGTEWDLRITTDESVTAEGVDDQANLVATGTLTAGGREVPISLHLTMVRIGANGATLGVTAFEDARQLHDAVTAVAVERLLAVANGEEPPATTIPAPVTA